MSDKKQGDAQNDPLFFNKIAAAVLAAMLLIFGLPQLAGALFGGGHHGGDDELHLAYCCVELETEAGGGEAEKAYDLGGMMSEASMPAGERGSALCASCHSFDKGGPNGTGPNLWNILGRDVASVSGFNYSGALEAIEGEWTYEKLDQYIANSQEFVPGGAMVQRIGRDTKRAELLVYLGSLSDDPMPYPAPLLEDAAEGAEVIDETGEAVAGAIEATGETVEEAVEDVVDE